MQNTRWQGTHDNVTGELSFNMDGTFSGVLTQKRFGLRQSADVTGSWQLTATGISLLNLKTSHVLLKPMLPDQVNLLKQASTYILPWQNKSIPLQQIT